MSRRLETHTFSNYPQSQHILEDDSVMSGNVSAVLVERDSQALNHTLVKRS